MSPPAGHACKHAAAAAATQPVLQACQWVGASLAPASLRCCCLVQQKCQSQNCRHAWLPGAAAAAVAAVVPVPPPLCLDDVQQRCTVGAATTQAVAAASLPTAAFFFCSYGRERWIVCLLIQIEVSLLSLWVSIWFSGSNPRSSPPGPQGPRGHPHKAASMPTQLGIHLTPLHVSVSRLGLYTWSFVQAKADLPK